MGGCCGSSEPGIPPPWERNEPCWKCKWISGRFTYTTVGTCLPGGDSIPWTVTVKSWYNEACRCNGLRTGLERGTGGTLWARCGCGNKKQFFGTSQTDPKFCMTKPPSQEPPCFEFRDSGPTWSSREFNCADKFRKKLQDHEFTIMGPCAAFPGLPAPDSPEWAQMQRDATIGIFNHFTDGAGYQEVQDIMKNPKNCDCTKVFKEWE